MRGIVIAALMTVALAVVAAQGPPATGETLGTVQIPVPVLASGVVLEPGAYELRLTGERPQAPGGQPSPSQYIVALLRGATPVAREVAEVLEDAELPVVGASARPVREGVSVQMLQGGEFLRVSVKRGTRRYLVHLPVQTPRP